jgi:hypothetical protein
MKEKQLVLDFFTGGVPAFTIFAGHLASIVDLLFVPGVGSDSTVRELALIGVVSYTEAFFKDHFAAILNVMLEKVSGLRNCGRNVAVDLPDLIGLGEGSLKHKFGFLLSERFDFGTPKAVNALYKDLLLVTPFSKDKAAEFDGILGIRNLLVHHGGVFTLQFNNATSATSQDRVFQDSVVVTRELIGGAASLVLGIAKSTVKATISRLLSELENAQPSDVRISAIKLMEFAGIDYTELASHLQLLMAGKTPFEDGEPANGEQVSNEDIPF